MPTIFEKDAGEHACPYHNFEPCLGERCMAWSWTGPTVDRCETDNLIDTADGPRPEGSPKTPDGPGWEMDGGALSKGYHRSAKEKLPPAISQRWVRNRAVSKGQCARHAGDQEYGPW